MNGKQKFSKKEQIILRSNNGIRNGVSIIELILAIAIFSVISLTAITSIFSSVILNQTSQKLDEATIYAEEAVEAVKSIKKEEWCGSLRTLTPGETHGLIVNTATGNYELSGTEDIIGDYTRKIQIDNVYRDSNGNITDNPSDLLDPYVKKVIVTVEYNKKSTPSEKNIVESVTYLSNWGSLTVDDSKGILVYSDEDNNGKEVLKYKVYSATGPCNLGFWTNESIAYDYPLLSGYTIRRVELYETDVRKEMIAVTRSVNNANQNAIYAIVWDGDGWGNPIELASFYDTSTYQNSRNYDGVYMQNGDFYVFYSDGTNQPKYRKWSDDGGALAWSSEGGIPNNESDADVPEWLSAKSRLHANDIMIAYRDMNENINTVYFRDDESTIYTHHADGSSGLGYENFSIGWTYDSASNDSLFLAYNSTGNSNFTIKKFDPESWIASFTITLALGSILNYNPLMFRIRNNPNVSNEYTLCMQGESTILWWKEYPIVCYSSSDGLYLVTTNAYNAVDMAFDFDYEHDSGDKLTVFSDGTSQPRYFVDTGSAQDMAGSMSSTVVSVVVDADPKTDNLMAILGDDVREIATNEWNGLGNYFYSDAGGHAFTIHETDGASGVYYWFDFKWEN